MVVGSPGSIVTRGLGSNLLITGGYGAALVISIPEIEIAEHVEHTRGRRPDKDRLIREPEERRFTLKAQLISVSGNDVRNLREHTRSVGFVPGELADAHVIDVDVLQRHDGIILEAKLESVMGVSSDAIVSATLPSVSEDHDDVIVDATVNSGTVGVDDIAIHIGKIRIKKKEE